MAVWLSEIKLSCHNCSTEQKIERGCEQDSPIPGVWKLGEREFQRCPLKLVTRQSLELIRAYNYFRQGYLPNSGGWMDQPAKLFEAFDVIDSEIKKIKDQKEKETNAIK